MKCGQSCVYDLLMMLEGRRNLHYTSEHSRSVHIYVKQTYYDCHDSGQQGTRGIHLHNVTHLVLRHQIESILVHENFDIVQSIQYRLRIIS